MALAYTVETLEGLDQGIQKLYVQKNGKFVLDVTGHEQTDNKGIPLSRLNQEIEKRKASEAALKELADQLIEDVPEDKRSIVPDLPGAAKISWLRKAFKLGFFTDKETPPIDAKRPGDKPPAGNDMNPVQRMATGYKSK